MGRWARSYPKLLDLDREIFQNLLALRHFSSMNRVGYGPCTALCESTGHRVWAPGPGFVLTWAGPNALGLSAIFQQPQNLQYHTKSPGGAKVWLKIEPTPLPPENEGPLGSWPGHLMN